MPASTPRSIETGTIRANAMAASTRVFRSRSQMICRTGTLNRVEKPRSPEASLPRYSTYRTTTGRSRPISFVSCATCSWVA